jgi:deoxyribodipyrimidine photo-lyase
MLCDYGSGAIEAEDEMRDMSQTRVRLLKEGEPGDGPVVYWMSRDQRPSDNWALHHAQRIAIERRRPVLVVFCLVPGFLGATIRQYGFMLRGLRDTEESLARYSIPFTLLRGKPTSEIPGYLARVDASILVTDFDPLRVKQRWKRSVVRKLRIPVHEVDAHNVIPCWVTSGKQEYSAFTIRRKIDRLLDDYLGGLARTRNHPYRFSKKLPRTPWKQVLNDLKVDRRVTEVAWITPGPSAAVKAMERFIREGLPHYEDDRNDPNLPGQSNLSPYLHFGQLSAERLAVEATNSHASQGSKNAFLEELIVRRELSDNYCYYNPSYDNPTGFPNWAQKTLQSHGKDKRPYLYARRELEEARTNDDLWNAAQLQMARTGKMHGYLRMYWAKKILEWSPSPEEAVRNAIYLNDRYELDGRDPNGYVGIAWSIGGVHDRPWPERPIFGKIRYMSREGCNRKFNVKRFIAGVADRACLT